MKITLDDVMSELVKELGTLATPPASHRQRQPVHTVYGGAQLWKADTVVKMGKVARRHLSTYFPDAMALAEVCGYAQDDPELAEKVYERVVEKLERQPIEDFRIDFEDGYGPRPHAEEDQQAVTSAKETARGLVQETLPPFLGIRLKALNPALGGRGLRTLDLFLTTLVEESGDHLGGGAWLRDHFVITLPKVEHPTEVQVLVRACELLEERLGLDTGSLRMELMVETLGSIINQEGRATLPSLVAAAGGRCVGAHFGVYDYTASCGIIAAFQAMGHPVCDLARLMMQITLGGGSVHLSDGATNKMPVGPHRPSAGAPLSALESFENRQVVHRVSKVNFDDVRHSLYIGFYQGWDLHPAQLPLRYAAVYSFFLENLASMTERLSAFIDKAAQATLVGDVFDDAATGQGLVNFFLQAMACGAVTEDEVAAAGVSTAATSHL